MTKQIAVLNDLGGGESRDKVWHEVSQDRWLFGHSSGTNKNAAAFWKMDLDGNAAIDELWNKARSQCNELAGGELKVIRQYANGHTFGLGGQPHQDDSNEGCFTLLYYPMPEWHSVWDGETLFQHDDGEIRCAIKPKPDRGIFFDSRIMHVGRAPSRYFGGLRVTVAFKLKLATK